MMDDERIPVFISEFYDFEMFDDGDWQVWADGRAIASGSFTRRDLANLPDEMMRVGLSKIGLYDNDRIGEQ
jgi:hypothetical protein